MKSYKRDLVQQANVPIQFEEEISFDLSQFQNNLSSLRQLHNLIVEGTLHYDMDTDLAVVDWPVQSPMRMS